MAQRATSPSTLKYPKEIKITGRGSTIRASFIKAIIPVIRATDEQINDCLKMLQQDKNNLVCSYCGITATEWDHFRPIVENKKPSGYVTDVYNLVPACGKCNQSKSGKHWKIWMKGNAQYSPGKMGTAGLEKKIAVLENFETWSKEYVTELPKEFLEGKAFNDYLAECETLIKTLSDYQLQAETIKTVLSTHKK